MQEALYLANIARSVTVIHRREQFRAEKILIDQLMDKVSNGNIKLALNHVLDEVLGDSSGVTGIRIRNTQTNSLETIHLQGVFIAIGHKPNTDIFVGQLDMEKGYIITHGDTKVMQLRRVSPGYLPLEMCKIISTAKL